MTTTSWTTSATVPLNAWSALTADLRSLLAVMGAGGATITSPAGNTGPVFTDSTIAFAVTLPGRGPCTVTFHREPSTGSVETSSPITDGLVLAAVERAGRHWGQLITVTSDAGTEARAVCTAVTEKLFGPGDRAVAGGADLDVRGKVGRAVASAQQNVADAEIDAQQAAVAAAIDANPDGPVDTVAASNAARFDMPTYLGMVLQELTAMYRGITSVGALFTPPPAPQGSPSV